MWPHLVFPSSLPVKGSELRCGHLAVWRDWDGVNKRRKCEVRQLFSFISSLVKKSILWDRGLSSAPPHIPGQKKPCTFPPAFMDQWWLWAKYFRVTRMQRNSGFLFAHGRRPEKLVCRQHSNIVFFKKKYEVTFIKKKASDCSDSTLMSVLTVTVPSNYYRLLRVQTLTPSAAGLSWCFACLVNFWRGKLTALPMLNVPWRKLEIST